MNLSCFKPVGLSSLIQISGTGMMLYSVRDPSFMSVIALLGVTSIPRHTLWSNRAALDQVIMSVLQPMKTGRALR